MTPRSKPVEFLGNSLGALREFPADVRREAGHQLDRLQQGLLPIDFKPMPSIGSGVAEIRLADAAGAFRVIYVAKLRDAIYVLHCFQKKEQRTRTEDLGLAREHFRGLMKEQRT